MDTTRWAGQVSKATVWTYIGSQKGKWMFHAYKFRLEPDINHTRELEFILESCRRLDKVFQAFFFRVMACEWKRGYPRFQYHDCHDSFT